MTYLDTSIVLSLLWGQPVHEQITGAIISYDILVESYVRYNIIEKQRAADAGVEYGRQGVQTSARNFRRRLVGIVENNMLMLLEEDTFNRTLDMVMDCGLDYADAAMLVQFNLGDVIVSADTKMIHYMMSKDAELRKQVEAIRDGARVLDLSVDDLSAYRALRSHPDPGKEQAVLAHKIYEEAHAL